MKTRVLPLVAALLFAMGTQSFADTCGDICTWNFWNIATPEEITAAIATVDVTARDELGNTPLHWAVRAGTVKNIADLFAAGADVNASGEDGWSPLHYAAGREYSENASILLKVGANVNARSLKGVTPLMLAESFENMKVLLDAGADVNASEENGGTPLHRNALYGTPEKIMTLLDAGADVNARFTGNIFASYTALHLAARYSGPENIKALLDAGADVNARIEDGVMSGYTALHFAAGIFAAGFSSPPENVIVLLDAGADGTAESAGGETPWDLAQDNERLKDTDAYWRLNDARFSNPSKPPADSKHEEAEVPAGPTLTAGEKDELRVAISSCWNVGSLSSDALLTTVVVAFDMSREARPIGSSMRMVSSSGSSTAGVKQAYENARRAIIRCTGDGYSQYFAGRTVEIVFSPERILIR